MANNEQKYPNNEICFRSDDSIGNIDAENDIFLQSCFVDIGLLGTIADCSNPKSILLGRTGTGKTALLKELERQQDHVIHLNPIDISMNYISSCNTLAKFVELGINLDPVFKLLWRHVLTLELIKHAYNLDSVAKQSLLERIMLTFNKMMKNKYYKECKAYFNDWNDSFWDATEYGNKTMSRKIEDTLKGEISGRAPHLLAKIDSGQSISEEETKVLREIGKVFIEKDLIKQLNRIFSFLNDHVLNDSQKQYYIIIDQLDEQWVDELFRAKLIRALIDIINDFRHIENAKIIIALRMDLLDHVMKVTRNPGFQEEKILDICITIKWTKKTLVELIDRRIEHLFKHRYTKDIVTHQSILPEHGKKTSPWMDYIINRTFLRPRDVIHYFNLCISESIDKPSITVNIIKQVEGEYSRSRLRFLQDEWSSVCPHLFEITALLKGKSEHFANNEINEEEIMNVCFSIQNKLSGKDFAARMDIISKYCGQPGCPYEDVRNEFIHIMHKIGMIGLKLTTSTPYIWSEQDRSQISKAEINSETKIAIHPMFFKVLGTQNISH